MGNQKKFERTKMARVTEQHRYRSLTASLATSILNAAKRPIVSVSGFVILTAKLIAKPGSEVSLNSVDRDVNCAGVIRITPRDIVEFVGNDHQIFVKLNPSRFCGRALCL